MRLKTRCAGLFEAYGPVDKVSIITDRDTGQPRGFAFVEMTDDEAASKAMEALNGTSLGGRNITVNEARPKADRPRREGGGGGGGRGGYGGAAAAVAVVAVRAAAVAAAVAGDATGFASDYRSAIYALKFSCRSRALWARLRHLRFAAIVRSRANSGTLSDGSSTPGCHARQIECGDRVCRRYLSGRRGQAPAFRREPVLCIGARR